MIGLAKDSPTVGTMESNLSDPNHKVNDKGNQEDLDVKPYSWGFNDKLKITPPSPGGTKTPATQKRDK